MKKQTALISIHGITKNEFAQVLRILADQLDAGGVDDNAMMETCSSYSNCEYEFHDDCYSMYDLLNKIKDGE
jgi:hypothetical protein